LEKITCQNNPVARLCVHDVSNVLLFANLHTGYVIRILPFWVANHSYFSPYSDFFLTNALLVTPTGVVHGHLHISSEGKIVQILTGALPRGECFDVEGKYVLPGAIETHGHMREPGLDYKEDIAHGTKAALAGGFTTIFDMPNTKPPITTVERLHQQIERYEQKSWCDFAINFGSDVAHIAELEKVDPAEIVGVKVFTAGHQTTPTTIPKLSDQAIIWEIAARKHFPVLVHAENQDLVTTRELTLQKMGRTDMRAHSEARDHLVVEMAAWEVVILAKYYQTRLWILHASTLGEFDAIAYGRSQGIVVSGEVAGYQLYFSTADYDRLGTLIKVCPALRSPGENAQLWQLVREGKVDG